MTLDVYRGRKTMQQQQQPISKNIHVVWTHLLVFFISQILLSQTTGFSK